MILLVIFVLVSVLQISDCEIIYGHKIDGFMLTSIVKVTFKGCAKECHLRPACLSLNYNRYAQLCELNSVPLPHTGEVVDYLIFMKKWICSDLENLNDIDLGRCNGHNCVTGQVCREIDSGFECKNEGMSPSSIIIENGIVKGNMNIDGSKVTIECSIPYTLYGPRILSYSESTGWGEKPVCAIPCLVPDILSSPVLQTIQVVIISVDEQTVYEDPDHSSVPQLSDIMTDSTVTFQCTTTETVQVNLTCDAGTWIFSSECSPGETLCILAENCNDAMTEDCINDICHCPIGTSYSYSQHSCVPRCSGGLANTLTKFNDVGMYNDLHDTPVITTFEQCVNTCLQSNDCLSFDYGPWGGADKCFIRQIVTDDYMDHMDDWYNGAFYQRDCS